MRQSKKQYIGKKIGKITIVEDLGLQKSTKRSRRYVIGECECGARKKLRADMLPSRFKCNCPRMIDDPVYRVWEKIKSRCFNPKLPSYKYYGGKGIKVCNQWLDPKVFISWAYDNGYQKGLQIDRIDNNGDYSPDNCRWVTLQENCQNRSTTKFSSEEIHEIRAKFESGLKPYQIHKDYPGVSYYTIWDIVKYRSWTNL